MATEFSLIKVNNGFQYATDADRDIASCYKIGQPLKVSAKRLTTRSLQHHRLFFGGLLEIMFQYWEPDCGLTTESERRLIMKFCQVLDDNGGNGEVYLWGKTFLEKLSQNRSQKIESPYKTKEGLLVWLKDKIDHVDLIVTPSGIKRIPKSINFNSMSQEQFGIFYKKSFSVCWKYILSQKFESEYECQRVIDQLSSMG